MTYAPKCLSKWSLPNNYFGAHWDNYYAAPCGLHRDSDVLEESNWHAQLAALTSAGVEVDDPENNVTVVQENHWAVGWVQWLAIRDTETLALQVADKLAERLANYPILDEHDWAEREYNAACNAWELASIDSRIEYCKRAGLSIFASRRAQLPPDDNDSLIEYLTRNY